ncbi:MAG: TetR/AcrR family transcriptional regulator [Actinomycetota bacterium]
MATRRLSRREKQEITRSAILRSASTLFARKGVEGTSMEEIARHAGLTQGAIYSNFSSKADLWWAIVEQISRTLDIDELVPGERPLRDELRDAGAAGAKLLHDISKTNLLLHQEFSLFLMRHGAARARAARELREGDQELGDKLEDTARKRGERLPMDGERMALLLNVIATGLIHHFMLDPDRIDEEFCADAFALLAGCGAEASRTPRRRAAGGSKPKTT